VKFRKPLLPFEQFASLCLAVYIMFLYRNPQDFFDLFLQFVLILFAGLLPHFRLTNLFKED